MIQKTEEQIAEAAQKKIDNKKKLARQRKLKKIIEKRKKYLEEKRKNRIKELPLEAPKKKNKPARIIPQEIIDYRNDVIEKRKNVTVKQLHTKGLAKLKKLKKMLKVYKLEGNQKTVRLMELSITHITNKNKIWDKKIKDENKRKAEIQKEIDDGKAKMVKLKNEKLARKEQLRLEGKS